MNIRSVVFWGRDFLTGGRVRAELHDVELLNSRTQKATLRRLELLEQHLHYVTSRVPYYRNLVGSESLDDFPVLSKEQIRSNQMKMIATGSDRSTLHVASTSGSTGTPFRVYQDKRKRQRVDAESIYFGQLAGYQVGYPLWHLKIWTSRNKRSRISAFARNIRAIDVSKFTETEAQELLTEMKSQRANISIIAYSSSLETIARTLRNKELESTKEMRVASVVGQSEPFSQEARSVLGRVFGIYPTGRYGLEELGVVAQQQLSFEESYRVNLASHIVEVLRLENNERASVGEVGRVVITDLVNKAQPMIRYDTGDLAVVGSFEGETPFVESLARLDGRSRERLYDVEDNPLAPMLAYNFWWKFPAIRQYQIVQRGRGYYVLRMDVDEPFDQESAIVDELRKLVGPGAHIDVEYSSVNYQQASGKRQAIVSEYNPQEFS